MEWRAGGRDSKPGLKAVSEFGQVRSGGQDVKFEGDDAENDDEDDGDYDPGDD